VLGEQLASAESVDSALTRYQELWQPVITEKQQGRPARGGMVSAIVLAVAYGKVLQRE
jgi:hypothetical protein